MYMLPFNTFSEREFNDVPEGRQRTGNALEIIQFECSPECLPGDFLILFIILFVSPEFVSTARSFLLLFMDRE